MNELTEDIYKGAEAGKQKQARRLTTAQLPVYRECSNLLYITIRVMHKAPRKMTRVLDEVWAQVLNSYFGFLTGANEYRTRTRIKEMLPRMWYRYFSIENRKKVIVKERYRYERN